jgi:hypothetical protein
MEVVNFTPRPLYPREIQEAGWATSAALEVLEKKRNFAPGGIITSDRVARSLFTIVTELTRLPNTAV